MSNRVSIEPIHGMQSGTEDSCPVCGSKCCLVDYVEATDHSIGKKYSFGIVNCGCGRILNKADLRKILPGVIFRAVFCDDILT